MTYWLCCRTIVMVEGPNEAQCSQAHHVTVIARDLRSVWLRDRISICPLP